MFFDSEILTDTVYSRDMGRGNSREGGGEILTDRLLSVYVGSLFTADAPLAGATSVGLNVGDLFCLGGALSWSLYIFRLTNFMQKGGDSVQLQVRVRPL